MADSQIVPAAAGPTCMESVNRVTKLPAVESTLQLATSVYGKVRDYNGVTTWACSTAETTVNSVYELRKNPKVVPLLQNLEGPIKTVDGVLCTGLDYVEDKIPGIKMPPTEIYNSTKATVNEYAEQAKELVEPKIKQARELVDPVVQNAMGKLEATKSRIEPTINSAKHMVEPIMQPAVDKVQQLREYGQQKVDEYLHRGHSKDGEGHPEECAECQEVKEKVEQRSAE